MQILLELTYTFNTIPIKSLIDLFSKLERMK